MQIICWTPSLQTPFNVFRMRTVLIMRSNPPGSKVSSDLFLKGKASSALRDHRSLVQKVGSALVLLVLIFFPLVPLNHRPGSERPQTGSQRRRSASCWRGGVEKETEERYADECFIFSRLIILFLLWIVTLPCSCCDPYMSKLVDLNILLSMFDLMKITALLSCCWTSPKTLVDFCCFYLLKVAEDRSNRKRRLFLRKSQ